MVGRKGMTNEITEAVLKARIRAALLGTGIMLIEGMTDRAYEAGGFAEFVGIVGKVTVQERNRAAGVCRRLGHRVTAAQILKG